MFKFMLAPLEDYAGPALRKICFDNGAHLTFTEMTRVEGIIRNNQPTLAKIEIKDTTPVQIQLLASNESQLKKFISNFKSFDGFCGFNLNLCCPSTNITKFGRGAAMVKRIEKTNKLVEIIKNKNYSISLKLSLGVNEIEKNNKVYLKSIKNTNADFYIVQTKHAMQKSGEESDHSLLGECVDTKKSIIANGGISCSKQIKELKKIGCSGVMIGRNAIKNPAIFNLLQNKKTKPIDLLTSEYKKLSGVYGENKKYFSNFLKVQKTGKFW
jgi:tRNA-dihydrouridine synthase B